MLKKNHQFLSKIAEEAGVPCKITYVPEDRQASSIIHDGKMYSSSSSPFKDNSNSVSVVLNKMILYPKGYIFLQEELDKNKENGYEQISQNEWGKIETTEKLQEFADGKKPCIVKVQNPDPQNLEIPGNNPLYPSNATIKNNSKMTGTQLTRQ